MHIVRRPARRPRVAAAVPDSRPEADELLALDEAAAPGVAGVWRSLVDFDAAM